jgi:hypothetical protein
VLENAGEPSATTSAQSLPWPSESRRQPDCDTNCRPGAPRRRLHTSRWPSSAPVRQTEMSRSARRSIAERVRLPKGLPVIAEYFSHITGRRSSPPGRTSARLVVRRLHRSARWLRVLCFSSSQRGARTRRAGHVDFAVAQDIERTHHASQVLLRHLQIGSTKARAAEQAVISELHAGVDVVKFFVELR